MIEQEVYFISRSRIETDFLHIAVEVAGRDVEKPPAHVPMHPDGAPVAALTLCIDIEHRLNVVIARRQLGETINRMPECSLIYNGGLTGLKTFGIYAENRNGVRRYLKARLRAVQPGDDEYYPSGNRA